MPLQRHLGAVALALLLSACADRSAEDRINAAMPVGADVVAAKDAIVALGTAADFEREYHAQLEIRAIQCSHGYAPSVLDTTDAIRGNLGDVDCFAQFDRTLGQWLGQRRIGRLLAAPPLRPVPATAPRLLDADGDITEVAFAERAGIAVVQSRDHYQVLDIATGATLAHGGNDGTPSLAPSPNGRMFVTGRNGVGEVRDSETGALLASYPGVHPWEFHWVGDIGAVLRASRGGQDTAAQVVFVDFASGSESPLAFGGAGIDRVLARPGKPGQYLLIGSGRLGEMAIERSGGIARARLVGAAALGDQVFARNASGLTVDGMTFFGVSGALHLLRLDSLDTLAIPFLPMQLHGAAATTDPDRLLLTGVFPQLRRGTEAWLYSIHDRTFAPVGTAATFGGRVVYIPSLHANAAIDGDKIVLLDAIPAGAPVPVDDFLAQREAEGKAFVLAQGVAPAAVEAPVVPMMQDTAEMAGARIIEKMQRENPDMDLSGARRVHHISDELWARAKRANDLELRQQANFARTVQPVPGPLVELARNASIEAVGVYEPAEGKRDPAHEGNRYGDVIVDVRHNTRPMILVLSSYEPVRWVISGGTGTNLAAVLVGGYYPQEVIGAGDVQVVRMGRVFAYKRDDREYHALDAEVARLTGKTIDHFQGEYHGDRFTVGNR